jgi:hypothetical protein
MAQPASRPRLMTPGDHSPMRRMIGSGRQRRACRAAATATGGSTAWYQSTLLRDAP